MSKTQDLERAALLGATIALEAAGVLITQTKAAKLVGVTRKTIGNWKRAGKISAVGSKVPPQDAIKEAMKL